MDHESFGAMRRRGRQADFHVHLADRVWGSDGALVDISMGRLCVSCSAVRWREDFLFKGCGHISARLRLCQHRGEVDVGLRKRPLCAVCRLMGAAHPCCSARRCRFMREHLKVGVLLLVVGCERVVLLCIL